MAVTSLRTSSIENFKRSNKMAGEVLYPEMTGGTEATFTEGNSTFKSHTFTASTTATITRAGYADLLLVAGGGGGAESGGASSEGGGGGAGGVLYRTSQYLLPGTYTVTIGAGSAGAQWAGNAAQGGHTFFYSGANPEDGFGALGGGGGARSNSVGGYGASSGGCGDLQPAAPNDYFDTQGHIGGTGDGGDGAGGGGGAGGTGGGGGNNGVPNPAGTNKGGAGGIGRIVNIIPASLATTQSVGEVSGTDVYWGGGAGGGGTSLGGDAGLGGGAAGTTGNGTAGSGTANTGGGGGGAEGSSGSPGNGGSGVVIVRYQTS